MLNKLLLSLCLVSLWSTPAFATRYWVSTTGSDANACSAIDGDADPGVYKLTPLSAQACLTVAGDRLTIKAGTYTGTGAKVTTFASGTVSNHTIIEGDPNDADGCALTSTCSVIFQPSSGNNTFINGPSHFTIRKLRLDQVNAKSSYPFRLEVGTDIVVEDIEGYNTATTGTSSGCFITGYSTSFVTFRRIHGHDCGVIGGFQHHGMYQQGDDVIVEDSWFHDNSSMGMQNYTAVGSSDGRPDRGIVRRSKFYNNGDHGLVLEGNDDQAYDNEVYGNGSGGIVTGFSGAARAKIHNNLVYNNVTPGIEVGVCCSSAKGSDSDVKNNIVFGHTTEVEIGTGSTGVTQSNNACSATDACGTTGKLTIAALTDITVSTSDFHHKAGSTAIGAGTTVSTRTCNGTCDIGPYESSTFASATINEAFLDVTIGMNDPSLVPIVPTAAGWSAACSGGANCGIPIVASASVLTGTSSVIRFPLTGLGGAGVCELADQVWTVSYSATTGATLDKRGQELATFTTQAVTNACGAAPPADPGTPHYHLKLDDNTGTNANDESVNNLDGTLTNGPTWVTGKHGFAVHMDGVDDYIAEAYGNAVNPSTQSLTYCVGVFPDAGTETGSYGIHGPSVGTNQRGYLAVISGTWTQAIQANGAALNTEFPVAAGWTHLCQVFNSGTDTATLYINGVVGTSAQSVKAYTSYTFASNFRLGQFEGSGLAAGTYDDPRLYLSALSAADVLDLYNAWEPPSPPTGCTIAQVGHQAYLLRQTVGGLVEAYRPLNATTVPVVAGGAMMVTTQTDFTVSDCPSLAEEWRYSCALCQSAGVWLVVPDVIGPDCMGFYGATNDPDILTGGPTARLSGALTLIPGQTQFTMAQTPVVDPTLNSSLVNRGVFKFDTCASGNTYYIKKYTQQGEAFSSYFPTAGAAAEGIGVVVVPMSAGSGF